MESNHNSDSRKKLTLNKKTLAKLDRDQLIQIKGGTKEKKHQGGGDVPSYAEGPTCRVRTSI